MQRAAILCLALLSGLPGALGNSVDGAAAPLRSAFLLRASGADQAADATSRRAAQAKLQRHFQSVLRMLIERSPASLATAVDRLEASRGERWDDSERAAWRKRLATARLTQIVRLHEYARRGLFPINEHRADRAVPVFVDNYDTACAVGHLMRLSGWQDVVARIEASNNLVYVTDRAAAPVAQWALTSGLTREEAALIQPAYEPPPFNSDLAQLTNGGSVSTDDLSYTNFRIGRGNSELTAFLSYYQNTTNESAYLSNLGVAVGDYLHISQGNGTSMNTLHEEWAFIGRGWGGVFASVQQPMAEQWVMLSYEVRAIKPTHFISAAALESIANFSGNYMFQYPLGSMTVTSRIMPQGVDGITSPFLALSSLVLSSPQGWSFLDGRANTPLTPQQGLTVSTIIKVTGPADFSSFINSFEVIPEPAGLTMAGVAGTIALRRRRCAALI